MTTSLKPCTPKYVLETRKEASDGYSKQKQEFNSFEELQYEVDQLHVSFDIEDIYQKIPYKLIRNNK